MRKYQKATYIEESEFLDKIFEFSQKLISVEKTIYYSFTKNDMILKAEILNFVNTINEILNKKLYFFMCDLIVFSFINREDFRSKLQEGYILYASFLLEVIESQIEKIIENTSKSIKVPLNTTEKNGNTYKLEKGFLHIRLLVSKILFVMKANNYSANVYFPLSLLSFFSSLTIQTLDVIKSPLFKVFIDLLFSLNFYGGEKFAISSLNAIFDLITKLISKSPTKRTSILQTARNILICYSDEKLVHFSFETLNFLLQKYKNEVIQDYFSRLNNKYKTLYCEENIPSKESDVKNIYNILIQSQMCLYSYKVYLPEYSLYLVKDSVQN
ncbi:hypothetical protein CWI36_0875p0010 [Hamiltosporidium magnivora]|uniref:Uncharacterized protein n=2 Tax=Hamiltosporidium magnivora TaxID=148818 RepID=A0A4Q9L902_9MICR|nr:hypothetical protein CWI36_0875p0010 [Hamiltosporidium magnivora]